MIRVPSLFARELPDVDSTRSAALRSQRRSIPPTTKAHVVLLTIVLAVFAGLCTFAYPSADDFCYAATAKNLGFVGSQIYWYANWSGRFTSSAIVTLNEMSGAAVYRSRLNSNTRKPKAD
jgi:hypothetical protein